MKKITDDAPEARSADVLAENVERLKALFPEAFTEGKIDFEILKQLLGAVLDEREEKYGLNWHGKRQARQLALTPSTGTLRPCPEESVDWDATRNLMIEGDNLEVLKILQKSYAGKVKLIYIDPPYNTGKDFIYPDNYRDNIRNYLELTGQVDSENRKLSSNTEASGRFHTDWLNMMYPRLKLARNLLQPDGVIFISIDDNEINNLKSVCNEIFGEENLLNQIVLENDSRARPYESVATTHEYILVYSKSAYFQYEKLLNSDKEFKYKDAKGGFDLYELRNRNIAFNVDNRPNLYYPFWVNPNNKDMNNLYEISLEPEPGWIEVYPQKSQGTKTVWRWSKETAKENLNTILFGKIASSDSGFQIVKKYRETNYTLSTVWSDKAIKTDRGTLETKALFDNRKYFEYPKPVELIRRLLSIGTNKNSIILDFFAGSGTTANAVMKINTEDDGSRQFILVQLPEPLDLGNATQKSAAEACSNLGKSRNIAELTKERLRRAAIKTKDENPMFTGDLGFRVFKLDTSNIWEWDPDPQNLEQSLLDSVEHIKRDRTQTDILYELLLKLGLDLCVPIETRTIAGKSVHLIGAGTLITCLDERIDGEEVEPLANGIAQWQAKVAPDGNTTVVFRDSAFADDVAKTNLTAILQQRGLGNVRSI